MSQPGPVYRIEIDETALDPLVMDKQEGAFAVRVGVMYIRDFATGFILGFSIVEEAATSEQDASLSLRNLDHPPLPEI